MECWRWAAKGDRSMSVLSFELTIVDEVFSIDGYVDAQEQPAPEIADLIYRLIRLVAAALI
ncbi:MAG: hypothetical protein ACFB0E_11565 [Leptolyngbyaceae cyanobacterium]